PSVLLLVVVTIQGITPTAYDLTSRGTFCRLSAALADQDFGEDDASPVDTNEPDRPGTPWLRKVTDRRPRLGFQEAGPSESMVGSGVPRISEFRRDMVRLDGLIYSLCRLLC